MDVIFELQRGRSFTIEIGFFDTIFEIKEKVQKYQGIPTSTQTLILNGQVLQDNDDVWKCEILHNTRINLQVSPDSDKTEDSVAVTPPPTKKIHLNVKTNPSKTQVVPLEVDVNDTVLRLKEKIHEIETVAVPVNRLLLHATTTGTELQDHQALRDCDFSDSGEIDVSLRPSPTTTSSGGGGSKKLKLMVLPKSGTKKVPVEMNASDNVGELRKELQKLHQRLQFHLPQDGYFFIYKQNVMDDDRSFRWHHVGQGDTIEIFNGSVTGGS
ncbi:ubiquitin domain-containing protein 7SL RNA1-like [Abrus precatorius]|uniref:Ubiquitin domain-containing protein 7SL RNA1-like n=1 Tax=Abrus precatorius TaxID=3816 RepID=A0A8B8MFU5_ABRPR|nr:ubiquitin domain-containing protein 7SL RNA1-like [Abrus precatorius]